MTEGPETEGPDTAGPETEPTLASRLEQDPRFVLAKKWTQRLLPIVLLAAAGFVVWHELRHVRLHHVEHELRRWGLWRTAASIAFSVLSFLTLALNEWAGLRWAGTRMPIRPVLYGSFCANAFGHTLGTAVLVGAAVRLRVYAPQKVTLATIVKTTAFCNVSFSLGMAGMAGGALVLAPEAQLNAVHLAPLIARLAGWVLLFGVSAYVALCALVRGTLRLFKHEFTLPSAGWALAQVAIGVVDNILTVLIVWILLPSDYVDLAAFTGAFATATISGVVSSVPGGAGVFEGVLLTLLPGLGRATLAAAFLGYRLFYFIAPLAIAMGMMALQRKKP